MIISKDILHDSRVDRHARALGEIGHEVVVLCRPSATKQPKRERREYYEVIRYPYPLQQVSARQMLDTPFKSGLSKLNRIAGFTALLFLTKLRLYFLALRIRAQLYYCNDLDTLDVGVIVKLAKRKIVYDSHELSVEALPIGKRRSLYRIFESLFVNFADVMITVNPFIAEELRRRYRIKKRIHIVMNCPDSIELPKHKASPKTITVLYHGLFDSDRGLENLIFASKYFLSHVKLVFRGEGKLESRLRQLASGASNISFEKTVRLKEVLQTASAADIGTIPYPATNMNNYFCSPNKLFEYIQAGLAVVASDLPFLRQIVVGNDVGLVFDPNDPSDIAKKINLVSNRENLAKFRQRTLEVRLRYTWRQEKFRLYDAIGDLET